MGSWRNLQCFEGCFAETLPRIASHANVLRGSSRNLSLRDEPLRTFACEAIPRTDVCITKFSNADAEMKLYLFKVKLNKFSAK